MRSTYPRQSTKVVRCGCCGGTYETNLIEVSSTESHWLGSCPHCGGLNAEGLSEKTSYLLVKGHFSRLPEDVENQRYFDMTYVEEATGQLRRRHGWYDPRNDCLTQVG